MSSREVVDAHLERIEAVNGHLNAIMLVLADEARAAADAADRSAPAGALHGVPVTVKENIDLAGTPTTSGVPALAEAVAPVDAPQVERLRAAGAIPIARTNLPDLGLRIHTDSSLRGLTRNPWDPNVTAGGSSGGEGSALASGMSPLGLGNDVGGSLRNPAHCCGIASIKPTLGRVPHATVIPPEDLGPAMQLMAVEGVMARRVSDVRLGLGDRRGHASARPRVGPRPARRAAARVAPRGLLAEPPGGDTHPEIAAAVRRAGDALADAGYDVVEVEPPLYEAALDVWGRLLFIDIRAQEPVLRQVMGPDAIRFLDSRRACSRRRTAPALFATVVERGAIAPRVERVPARASADPQPDLDAAAVPARLGRRERGAGARHDAAAAPGDAGEPARAAGRRRAGREGRRPARGRAGDGRALPGARLPGGRRGDREPRSASPRRSTPILERSVAG